MHQIDQHLAKALLDDVTAALADDGAKQPALLFGVLDEPAHEAEWALCRVDRCHVTKAAAQVVEPADEQLFLVGEVRIEGRAADVGAIADVLDADGVPTALEDQPDERLAQRAPSSLHTTVFCLRGFGSHAPLTSWTDRPALFGTGQTGRGCRLRARVAIFIVDTMSSNDRVVHHIELRNVSKVYPGAGAGFTALDDVTLTFPPGELTAIVGKSGSGKSTLVNLVAGLDRPTRGAVLVGGTQVHALGESELASWRGHNVGVVFQFFQLLPTLTVAENVMLPMDFCATYPAARARARANELLDRVGIADQASKLPATLSGGQQQRAAIARALANDPALLVADEPTGNLDSRTADAVLQLLSDLARSGKTVIVVTHERDLARRFDRVIELADGRVVGTARSNGVPAQAVQSC